MSSPVCPMPFSQFSSRVYPAGREPLATVSGSDDDTGLAVDAGAFSSVADGRASGTLLVSLVLLAVLLEALRWSWGFLESASEKDCCSCGLLHPSKPLPRARPTTQSAAILPFSTFTANASDA